MRWPRVHNYHPTYTFSWTPQRQKISFQWCAPTNKLIYNSIATTYIISRVTHNKLISNRNLRQPLPNASPIKARPTKLGHLIHTSSNDAVPKYTRKHMKRVTVRSSASPTQQEVDGSASDKQKHNVTRAKEHAEPASTRSEHHHHRTTQDKCRSWNEVIGKLSDTTQIDCTM